MKKILLVVFTLFCFGIANAQTSGRCGTNVTWTLSADSTLTISGTGDMYDYTSYGLGLYHPWGEKELKKVVIENGVTSIGNMAFFYCTNLTSITIPNSVISIGENAFSCCYGLSSIAVSENIISVSSYAFDNTLWYQNLKDSSVVYIGKVLYKYKGTMPKNTTINIKEGTTTICSSAFYGCSGLTSITIPNSVTSIGEYAFEGCRGLTSITIPNSVTSIGENAFYGCAGLTSVTIPNSVTTIGKNAFYYCNELKAVGPVTDGKEYNIKFDWDSIIPSYFFRSVGSLTSITIPGCIKTIYNYTFTGCTNLSTVILEEGVENIESGAFSGCSSLTSIAIPNSVTSIGNNAFGGTALYENQPNGVVYIDNVLYKYKGEMPQNTSINIKEGTRLIADNAFEWCSGLTSITIPNNVTSIGRLAFHGCSSLTSVTIPNGITTISERTFCNCKSLTSISIPNSVTSIGNDAFWGCSSLTSISIPNSVTSIGNDAFWGCSSLTSVTIPNGITTISESAFNGCSSLKSITIPSSVTKIENNAFGFCDGIISINIPQSIDTIGDGAFNYCKGLKNVNIYGDYIYGDDVFIGCNNLKVNFGKGVTKIPKYIFNNCDGLVSVNISESVKTIEEKAFNNCYNLTSISIHKNVTSIEKNAFGGCCRLTEIFIPKGVEKICDYAFIGCNGLKNITFSEGNKNIGNFAFSNCSEITSITLPSTITNIGKEAFADCYNLKYVTCLAPNAPNVSENIFKETLVDTIYVPQNSIDTYKNDSFWGQYIIVGYYEINAQSSDISQGNVNVNQNIATQDETIVITAKPQKGYRFIQWSDGNRENPRTIKADSSINITAIFDNKYYVSGQAVNGSINGLGGFELGSTTLLTATPNQGYYFVCWSDGNRENPRAITVNNDIDISAVFDNKYNVVVLAPNGEKHGDGKYEYGTKATIVVAPSAEYQFKQWNDGSHENPRFVTVTSDTILIAEFEVIGKENNSDLSNSINETSATKIVVYPSPTTSIINVAGAENGTAVCIYNINGALVMSEYLNGNQLNVGSLPKGVYFIEIENLGRTKFIKQ